MHFSRYFFYLPNLPGNHKLYFHFLPAFLIFLHHFFTTPHFSTSFYIESWKNPKLGISCTLFFVLFIIAFNSFQKKIIGYTISSLVICLFSGNKHFPLTFLFIVFCYLQRCRLLKNVSM